MADGWSIPWSERHCKWGEFLAPYGLVIILVTDLGRVYVGLRPDDLGMPPMFRLEPATLSRRDETVLAKVARALGAGAPVHG